MLSINNSIKRTTTGILLGLLIGILFSVSIYVFASPPDSAYNSGETLDPSCAPGDTSCTVTTSATSVPYTGATSALDIGSQNFTTTGATTTGNLSVNSNITLGDASGDSVTSNAATWTFANDTNLVLSGGINGLAFDTDTLTIDATNNRVGIGTTVPSAQLHIIPTSAAALNIDAFGADAGNTGELRFSELVGNGVNYTGFKSQDTLAANVVYTLPSADGTSGQVLSTNSSGTLAWTTGSSQWTTSDSDIYYNTGNVGIGTTGPSAQLHVVQAVNTSGTPTSFLIAGAAHTTLTASTEATDINFNLARTVQFATGALTTQRAFLVQAPTYGFVGASTLTTATTMEISGAPIAGTNATITNAYGLRINAGQATAVPLVVKGATSQSANLQEWQNSSAGILSSIDSSGI